LGLGAGMLNQMGFFAAGDVKVLANTSPKPEGVSKPAERRDNEFIKLLWHTKRRAAEKRTEAPRLNDQM